MKVVGLMLLFVLFIIIICRIEVKGENCPKGGLHDDEFETIGLGIRKTCKKCGEKRMEASF